MNLIYRESLITEWDSFFRELGKHVSQAVGWGWKLRAGTRVFWIKEELVMGGVKSLLTKYGLPQWEDNNDLEINYDTHEIIPDRHTEDKEMKDFTHYTNPDDHRQYVRVSQVLDMIKDDGIQRWREVVGKDEADRRTSNAAEIGTEVHDVIKEINLGRDPDIPDRSFNMVMRYLAWKDRWVEKILFAERTFFSKKYGFACTIDLGLVLRGAKVPILADIKTGGIRKKKFGLQVAGAYKIAAKENGIDTGKAIILPLDKKVKDAEEFEVITLEDEGCAQGFLDALGVYRYMTGEKW
jgi:hypothetical protein